MRCFVDHVSIAIETATRNKPIPLFLSAKVIITLHNVPFDNLSQRLQKRMDKNGQYLTEVIFCT